MLSERRLHPQRPRHRFDIDRLDFLHACEIRLELRKIRHDPLAAVVVVIDIV